MELQKIIMNKWFKLMWVAFTAVFIFMGIFMVAVFQPSETSILGIETSFLEQVGLTGLLCSVGALLVFLIIGAVTAAKGVKKMIGFDSQLSENGKDGMAEVISVEDMNAMVNVTNPVMKIKVRVFPDLGSPFDAEFTQAVPLTTIPQLQPGKRVKVKYDPTTKEVKIV